MNFDARVDLTVMPNAPATIGSRGTEVMRSTQNLYLQENNQIEGKEIRVCWTT